MHSLIQMPAGSLLNIKTLNDVAVKYFELGLQDLSYQIWDKLYHEIQGNSQHSKELLPIICCNMGNMLRQTGYYEEAYLVCRQGLKWCFGADMTYAMPELIIQLSILCLKLGYADGAEPLYSLGKNTFFWSRQETIHQTIEEIMEQDFLLYFKEDR